MSALTDGVVLGGLSFGAAYLVYKKLPERVRKFANDHQLLTRFTAAGIIFTTLGVGVTGLFAAAVCDLIVAAALYVQEHPQDFTWLDDLVGQCRGGARKLAELLREQNQAYLVSKN